MITKILSKIKIYEGNTGALRVHNRIYDLYAVHSRFSDYITVFDGIDLVFESSEGVVKQCVQGQWMEYFGIASAV